MKEKANACYKLFLETDGFLTKERIGELLGITNERSVREVIGVVATKCPIISTSNQKGYKMAKNVNDLEEVNHTCAEIGSRIAELEKRLKPLNQFCKNFY